jgi:hypothetical protein
MTLLYKILYVSLKGGDEMEMDMQDPSDMWAGIEMLASLSVDRGRGGKTDFG